MRALLVCVAVAMCDGWAAAQSSGTPPSVRELTPEEKERVEKLETVAGWTVGSIAAGVGVWFVAVLVPPVIASARGHLNTMSIFLVSLFFGWTCIGWCIALIWAFTGNTRAAERRRYQR